jgi:hypothetical protein
MSITETVCSNKYVKYSRFQREVTNINIAEGFSVVTCVKRRIVRLVMKGEKGHPLLSFHDI